MINMLLMPSMPTSYILYDKFEPNRSEELPAYNKMSIVKIADSVIFLTLNK